MHVATVSLVLSQITKNDVHAAVDEWISTVKIKLDLARKL